MSIKRINHFLAQSGREADLREFLKSIISTIRSADGCETVELLVDQKVPAKLVIVEQWRDVAAHQAAAKMIPPQKMAEVGPLLAEPPMGQYYDFG